MNNVLNTSCKASKTENKQVEQPPKKGTRTMNLRETFRRAKKGGGEELTVRAHSSFDQ